MRCDIKGSTKKTKSKPKSTNQAKSKSRRKSVALIADKHEQNAESAIALGTMKRVCQAATITAFDPGISNLGVVLVDTRTKRMIGCDLINLCAALDWENQKNLTPTAVAAAMESVLKNDTTGIFGGELVVTEKQMLREDMIAVEAQIRARFPNSITVSPSIAKKAFPDIFTDRGSHYKNKMNAILFGEKMAWYAYDAIIKKFGKNAHHIFDALSMALAIIKLGEDACALRPKPIKRTNTRSKPKVKTANKPRARKSADPQSPKKKTTSRSRFFAKKAMYS